MKKKLAMLLSLVLLAACILTGCGKSESPAAGEIGADGKEEEEGALKESAGAGEESGDLENHKEFAFEETQKLIVTYLYQTASPADLIKVQEAVNAISLPAINVEIEFKPLGFGDSFSNYSLWISSGETVDLMMIAFQDIKNYVNSGQLEALDEYITPEWAPVLYQLTREFPIATTVQGETYGLTPVGINYGEKSGIVIRGEYLEETGYEKKDIYTMEDLTAIFASIKENHPECYPFGVVGNGMQTGSSNYTLLCSGDFLGGSALAGVLLDKDSTQVVNLFSSEEYKTFLKQMADWYEAGYIVPDAATTDTTNNEMLKNGKTASFPMSQKPEMFGANFGFPVTGLATGEGRIGAVSNGTNWTVPITSSNPAAAIKFMDLLYSNPEVSNLIMWGIQGEHYGIKDGENGVIEFINGYDDLTSPYYNSLGFWGDRRTEYTFDETNTRKEHEAYTNECMNNKYKSYGFVFDSSDVSNQMISCQSVLDQYQKALETGSLGSDWESTYNTMAEQLDTAGIEDIIKECQAQLNAYLEK